jgi:hypothetical protein
VEVMLDVWNMVGEALWPGMCMYVCVCVCVCVRACVRACVLQWE